MNSSAITVFYSWQSDTPEKRTRYLIRRALQDAVRNVNTNGLVEEAIRLDHDTAGVSGTPAIADTILEKIRNCAVFVADLTFVSHNVGNHRKSLPNSNVTIELGYAAGTIGWDRVICVMNESHGLASDQVFNVAHRRWPIRFKCESDDTASIGAARQHLTDQLTEALRLTISSEVLFDYRKARLLRDGLLIGASDETIRVAVEQEPRWRNRLFARLLGDRLRAILTELAELRDGLVFLRKKRLRTGEYIDWMQERPNQFLEATSVFTKRFYKEWAPVFDDPFSNIQQIDAVTATLVRHLRHFVELESEQRSIVAPPGLEAAHEATLTWGGDVAHDVFSWQRSIIEIVESEAVGHREIVLKIHEAKGTATYLAELKKYIASAAGRAAARED